MSVATRPIATLFTGHFYHQRRRGSMHWLADELVARNWKVRFVTVGYSFLSFLMRDQRLRGRNTPSDAGQPDESIENIVHITPFHPVDLRLSLLNAVSAPVFSAYPELWRSTLRAALTDAKIAVVESGMPIVLAPLIKKLTPAKLVYRVNDDVQVMRSPDAVRTADRHYAAIFDRVSIASPKLAERYSDVACVAIDPMGLDKTLFNRPQPSPFATRWEKEVICSGSSQLDHRAVICIARMRPHWRFTIIGRLRRPLNEPNIVTPGELSFGSVMPYVQHADIGFAPYPNKVGIEYQAHHSNRLLQYAHIGLPTLVPTRVVHSDFENLIGYEPGNIDSIDRALRQAEARSIERKSINVPSWDALCDGVLDVFA